MPRHTRSITRGRGNTGLIRGARFTRGTLRRARLPSPLASHRRRPPRPPRRPVDASAVASQSQRRGLRSCEAFQAFASIIVVPFGPRAGAGPGPSACWATLGSRLASFESARDSEHQMVDADVHVAKGNLIYSPGACSVSGRGGDFGLKRAAASMEGMDAAAGKAEAAVEQSEYARKMMSLVKVLLTGAPPPPPLPPRPRPSRATTHLKTTFTPAARHPAAAAPCHLFPRRAFQPEAHPGPLIPFTTVPVPRMTTSRPLLSTPLARSCRMTRRRAASRVRSGLPTRTSTMGLTVVHRAAVASVALHLGHLPPGVDVPHEHRRIV